jgi:hypothetical protein
MKKSGMNRRHISNRSYSKKDTIVFCEDEKSSYFYLEELIKEYRRGSQIKLKTTKGQTPKQIIDVAIEYNDNKDKGINHIFCVFDIDKIHRKEISDFYEIQLNEYINKAKNSNIKCIICDPSFEFYLLLNFEETNTIDEIEINNKLKGYFSNQRDIGKIKNDSKLFAKLVRNKDYLDKTIERNEKTFNNKHNKTNFFELVRFIIEKGEKNDNKF